MGGVTNATNSQIGQNTSLDQANATSTEPEVPQSAPESPQPKSQNDPAVTARNQQGLRQNAAEHKTNTNIRSQFMREELSKRMEEGSGKPALFGDKVSAQTPTPAAAPNDGLRPGEAINATITRDHGGMGDTHYEFQRPVTKEQAAAIIFQNGKIPADTQLVQGKGNTWTIKFPKDADGRQNAVRHFNSHTETIIPPTMNPMTGEKVKDGVEFYTWVGGAPKTHSGGPKREDLNNNQGFKIMKHYELDEGQRKTETLGKKGVGYEVAFDKPMTKDEVMQKVFHPKKITEGEVRLVPMSPEPTTLWRVEVIGSDAASAFKLKPGRAFQDSTVYTKHQLPTGTPAGIRKAIENHTIPKDATFHKPNVYVWEQDGHMMYVKSNNKGKDGYYEPQFTKLPTDEEGLIAMRFYMKEQGMAPREAWGQFWQDAVDQARMKIGMISSSARMPSMIKAGTPKSSFGEPPVPARTARSVRGHVDAEIHTPTSGKPSAKVDPYANTQPAGNPSTPVAQSGGQKPAVSGNVQPGRTPTIKNPAPPPPQPIPPKPAAVNKSKGPGPDTVATTGPRRKDTGSPDGSPVTEPTANESRKVTIQTPAGPQEITVGELRGRINEARLWRTNEARRLSDATGGKRSPASFWPELNKEAAKRFNLPDNWPVT